jgi:hypothetical protein
VNVVPPSPLHQLLRGNIPLSDTHDESANNTPPKRHEIIRIKNILPFIEYEI